MKIKNILMLASAVATTAMSNSASAASTSAAFTGTFTTPNMDPNWNAGKATGTATAPCNGSVSAFVPSSLPYTLAPSIAGYSGNLAADPQQPLVAHNYGSNFNNGQISILANETAMHPGPANECAILRYTVPAGGGGVYSISGAYQRADSNAAALGDGVKGMILKNGTAVGNIVDTGQGTGSGTAVAQQVTLCPGDTVDFAVHMKSKYFYDTTQLVGRLAKVGDTNSCSPPPSNSTCCPPVVKDRQYLEGSWQYNQIGGETITNHYGLKYAPNAVFDNQMALWSPFASSALAAPGWTGLGVAMRGEMKTDNPTTGTVNPNWPPNGADWIGGATIQAGWLTFWPSVYGNAIWYGSPFEDAALPKVGAAHMEPNGRRYMIGITYYIVERQNGTQQTRLRKIDCEELMFPKRFNAQMFKVAPGTKPALESSSVKVKLNTPAMLDADQTIMDAIKRSSGKARNLSN